MNNDDKLEPCICGTEAQIDEIDAEWYICCKDLDCPWCFDLFSLDKEVVIKAWNTRPAPAQVDVDLLVIEAVIEKAIKTNQAHYYSADRSTNAIAIAKTLQSQGYLSQDVDLGMAGIMLMKRNIKLREALEKLSCLGNGDRLGNSNGNLIAQRALEADDVAALQPQEPITQDEAREALDRVRTKKEYGRPTGAVIRDIDAVTFTRANDIKTIRKALTPTGEDK